MRYFIHLSYDGFLYQGWQRQSNTANTIQQVLESHLSDVLKENITLVGCGRTDACVHAFQYIGHFDLKSPLPDQFEFIINHRLPDEIVIHQILPVKDNQHARYDASLRQYQYYISLKKDPFLSKYSAYYGDKKIDPILLKEAIQLISSYNDFTNMSKQPDKNGHNVCTIYESEIEITPDEQMIKITLSANRFLRGMVRILVAKAMECATSNISYSEYEAMLANKLSRKYKNMAYPQGLFLSKVVYPYLNLENKSTMFNLLENYFSAAVKNFK